MFHDFRETALNNFLKIYILQKVQKGMDKKINCKIIY